MDDAVTNIIKLATQLDSEILFLLSRACLRLSIRYGGICLCSLVEIRHAKYIDGMVQGISTLMDRQTEEGIILLGRLCTDYMKYWLDPNSFVNTPKVNPWDTLLTYVSSSLIMQVLIHSWTTLQEETCSLILDDDSEKEKPRLLHHPLWSAGFEEDGKFQKL